MFSSIRLHSVMLWDADPVAKANEQMETMEARVAFREALTNLRAAQRHLARHEGKQGADMNAILAGEIESAIGVIQGAVTWEFDCESAGLEEGSKGKYGAAMDCLIKAEKELGQVAGRTNEIRRQALLHVRTAKWWVEPKSAPRYTQVFAGAR